MPAIRILIVDDHSVLRAGLESLFGGQPEFTVVGQAGTVRQMTEAVAAHQPDVICLDVSLPDGSGLTAIKGLRANNPSLRILVLTSHEDPSYAQTAFAAGAHGFVLKHSPPAELFAAVRAVAQHRLYLDPSLGQKAPRTAAAPPDLSQRELEVIKYLAAGLTNQQAADRMFLSVKTVETYRARLANKLGLPDRSALVRYAIEMGLLEVPSAPPADEASGKA